MLVDPQAERIDTKYEYDEYPLQVVALTQKSAQEFFGLTDMPVDMGAPSDIARYLDGARVWGFKGGAK